MNALVVLAGDFPAGCHIDLLFKEADFLVAADRGAESLLNVDIIPDVLIGDMDSISETTKKQLLESPCEDIVFPQDKDATDAELAIDHVIANGATKITLLGVAGGPRIDHQLASMLLLLSTKYKSVTLCAATSTSQIYGITDNTIVGNCNNGDTLSILPLVSEALGVSTTGLLWPLKNTTLHLGSSRSVSNQCTGLSFTVSVEKGSLLIIQTLAGKD